MSDPTITDPGTSQVHATFVLERDLAAPAQRVWHALSDAEARHAWFGDSEAFVTDEESHDFSVGGQTVEDGQWHDGPRSRFVATYTDIVDQQRIVYTYDMWVDGAHLSTSLTTIVLEPSERGTLLTFTEQGVHLDGMDTPHGREEGTGGILDALRAYVES